MSNLLAMSGMPVRGLTLSNAAFPGQKFKIDTFDELWGPSTMPPLPSGAPSVSTPWFIATPYVSYGGMAWPAVLQRIPVLAAEMDTLVDAPMLNLLQYPAAIKNITTFTVYSAFNNKNYTTTAAFGRLAGATSVPLESTVVFDILGIKTTLNYTDPDFWTKVSLLLDPPVQVLPGTVDFAVAMNSGTGFLDKFQALLAAAPRPLTAASANALLTDPALLTFLDPFAKNLLGAPSVVRTFAYLNAAAGFKKLGTAQFDRLMDAHHNVRLGRVYDAAATKGLILSDASFSALLKGHPWGRLATTAYEMMDMYRQLSDMYNLPSIWELMDRVISGGRVRLFDACDCPIVASGFTRPDGIQSGTLYSSPLYHIEVMPMEEGVFGECYMDDVPFRININAKVAPGRQMISAAHEMMHGMDQVAKLGLTHEQIHQAGTTIATEMFPALKRLETQQAGRN